MAPDETEEEAGSGASPRSARTPRRRRTRRMQMLGGVLLAAVADRRRDRDQLSGAQL